MKPKPKVSDHTDIVRDTCSGIEKHRDADGGTTCQGHVATKWGYVIVSSRSKPSPSTTLVFIWGEKHHYRYLQAFYNPEPLASRAREFAKEIATSPFNLFE